MTPRARTAAALVAIALVGADASIVVLALPQLLRELQTTIQDVSWVITAFTLAAAITALPSAYACRRLGANRVAAVAAVIFATASLGAGFSTTLTMLIGWRVVQGVGGAALSVATLELLRVDTGDRHRSVVLWATAAAIGAAVGPALGGVLEQVFSWKAIFFVQAPIALAILPGTLRTASPRGDWETLELDPVPARERPGTGGPVAEGLGEAEGTMLPTADPTGALPAPPRSETLPARIDTGEVVVAEGAARPMDRPAIAAQIALGLLSAALVSALFLLVILLVEGWRLEPLAAALVVTAMPVGAAAARLVASRFERLDRAAAGALAVAGGLGGLAIVPAAEWWWTIPPQLLIGLGLGLGTSALVESCLDGKRPEVLHGAWTVAARNAGIVVGLVLLTPVLQSSLDSQLVATKTAGTALVLDANLPLTTKISVAQAAITRVEAEPGRVPDVHGAFAGVKAAASDRPALQRLEDGLADQVARGATRAFSSSFLGAALLALAALVPLAGAFRRGRL